MAKNIMGNMGNLMGSQGGSMLGAGLNLGPSGMSQQAAASDQVSKGKIKTSVARKLFGDEKAKLAMAGGEVSNMDGDILTYENGSFYLA